MPTLRSWPAPALALFLSAVAGGPANLPAQESSGTGPKEPPPPVRRFFDHPIDYWQRGLAFEEEKKAAPEKDPRPGATPAVRKPPPSEWGQIVKQADGTSAYQELPRPLVEVLEDPSPEKIRAYFEWKLTRTQKILRAAQAMKEYRGELGLATDPQSARAPEVGEKPKPGGTPPPPPAPPPQPGPARETPRTPFTLTYFHRAGCSHCDTQDLILASWLKARPEGKLVLVDFGEKPELWQRYRVRGTPSLVLESEGSGRPVFLEGVTPERELEKALEECRVPPIPAKTTKGGKP